MKYAALLVSASLAACSASAVEFEPCDIRDSDCQESVFLAVQGVRNTGWDPWLDMPPMRVISLDQYRAELEQRRLLPRDPSAYDYYTPAYKAFHLYDPDEPPDGSTEFSVTNVAAYYEETRRDITIIDRGKSDVESDTHTLAHELGHAAQERDVSFSALRAWVDSADTSNVRGAIVEGEAEHYANLVSWSLNDPSRLDRINFVSTYTKWLMDTRTRVAANKSPLRAANMSLRYPLGALYFTQPWLDGGPLGVRRAFAAHPASSVAFMTSAAAAVSGEANPCKPPPTPPGFRGVTASKLGAWALYAFATRFAEAGKEAENEAAAWRLAQSWADDQFLIYADDAKNLAVVWQLRFVSPQQLESFMAAANMHLPAGVQMARSARSDRLALSATTQGTAVPAGWSWSECGS
jgi:hypothetical protein